MKLITSLVVACALGLALCGTALAQSSVDGYNEPGGQIQTQVGGSGGSDSNGSGGSLPFTGLDVALLVGAGGLLLVAGFGMRRLTRAPNSAV
jgi:hypothetical protein